MRPARLPGERRNPEESVTEQYRSAHRIPCTNVPEHEPKRQLLQFTFEGGSTLK